MLVAQHGLDNRQEPEPNGIVGGSFALDDLVGCVAGLVENAIDSFLIIPLPVSANKFIQTDTGDISQAPQRQLTVSVLADDISVDAARVDPVVLAQHETQ